VSTVLRSALLFTLLALASAGCGCGSDPSGGAPAPTGTPATRSDAAPAPAATPVAPGGMAWPQAKLLRRLAGRRVAIGDQVIRVDAATVTCGGTGRPAGRVHGRPAWSRFRCVQPTFPPGSVAGPDAIFFVQPVDRTRLVVTERRMTRY
jgi:hypothetical protein